MLKKVSNEFLYIHHCSQSPDTLFPTPSTSSAIKPPDPSASMVETEESGGGGG
jgi:hypothetical protein